jgi:hypothetical protein
MRLWTRNRICPIILFGFDNTSTPQTLFAIGEHRILMLLFRDTCSGSLRTPSVRMNAMRDTRSIVKHMRQKTRPSLELDDAV